MFFQRWRKRRLERRARREHLQRCIFSYETHQGTRHADPMQIAMALKTDPDYLPRHLDEALQNDPVSMEIVANAASRAFGIQRLDESTGNGMTIAELIGLVDAFDLWCFRLQKKT